LSPIQTEVLIIGAGPVGLFQVFQLGLQEISAHVLDAHDQIGGQCSALYPDKYIYDIPGIKKITGQQLVEQLQNQIAPFKTPVHLGSYVQSLKPLEDGFEVTTQKGVTFKAKCVVIAAGVGAFVHKELPLAELKEFRANKSQVFNSLPENADLPGKDIVIYGNNEHAVTTALKALESIKAVNNAPSRGSVTLVYRRDKLELEELDSSGQELLRTRFEHALKTGELDFKVAQITAVQTNNSSLSHVILTGTDGLESRIKCDYLIESLGLSPKLGPITEWELAMQRRSLTVSPETFCTSIPGVFAVGDINTYPGKKKLILSGFHEATLAAFAIASHLTGRQSGPLEYTSSSTRIHKLLGV